MRSKEIINKVIFKTKIHGKDMAFKLGLKNKQKVIDEFHKLYYESGLLSGTWKNTYFMGVPAQKCPLDLFIYQEILYDVKPDLIIETGTAGGGGALFLASICDLLGKGEGITIDISDNRVGLDHPRVTFLLGSSTSPEVLKKIEKAVKKAKKVMVVLDSDHSKKHVLNELKLYSKLVTPGSYLIVEDKNVNGNPVNPYHGDGPNEALNEFLITNKKFVWDKDREKFLFSFNPGGYLK